MDGVFYWLLNMSILGSVTGALLYCLRFIPRFPKFFSYALWTAVALRFCVPAAVMSGLSFIGIFAPRSVPVIQTHAVSASMLNFLQAAKSYSPMVYRQESLATLFSAAGIVWACIAALLMLGTAALCLISSRRYKPCEKADGFYICETLSSPAVCGVFRPRILVPPAFASSPDLKYILAHENIHVKRRDNLWRLVAVMIACAHWFNPFVWLFVKAFFKDMETACDQKALASMLPDERLSYARALVAAASRDALALSFGGNPVKTRVLNILTYKKMTAFSACAFAALAVAVALVLLTNPA
jgi:beta-lactamase regulating signal transducer with metallopeptidase domain